MESLVIAIPAAFWLGLLTSISPCPLATNIAALSFVGREVGSTKRACWAGILYTAGRSITYAAIGVAFGFTALSLPLVSDFFQSKMNSILGPILILVGMLLLDLLHLDLKGSRWLENAQSRAAAMGLWGALLLGMLFAASFCPVSAALFFGSLVPISIKVQSVLLIPAIYGVATGLPVLIFSLFIVFGLSRLGSAYGMVVSFERSARLVTGAIFILVGIYYSLIYIFGLAL